MYEGFAEFALKYLQKKEVGYGEVRLEEHEGSHFTLKNSTPEVVGFDNSVGMALRFLLNNSMGFVSINKFTKNDIKNAIDKSIKLVKKSQTISENISLSEEKTNKKTYKVKQKLNFKDVSPEEKLILLKDVDKSVNDILGRYFSYHDDICKKYFINTDGTRIKSEIPRGEFMYFITVKEGNKSGQKHWQFCNSGGYERIKNKNIPKLILQDVNDIKTNLREAKKPPKGKLDVVLGSEVTGIAVHESVGHPFEADRIFGREAAQAGESFIGPEMIGKQIGSDCVTVVDDPTLKYSAGYYDYDDEGVKARRRFLIKDGKINEFLHNRETATKMGLKSNGAARAENYDKEAIVRMANTFLLPGKYSEKELIEGVKYGVFIKDYTEWNINDTRYQMKYVGGNAFLIKNGKLSYPVFKPALEITTPTLWSSIDAVGKNLEYGTGTCGKGDPMQGVPAFLGGPSVRLRGITLS